MAWKKQKPNSKGLKTSGFSDSLNLHRKEGVVQLPRNGGRSVGYPQNCVRWTIELSAFNTTSARRYGTPMRAAAAERSDIAHTRIAGCRGAPRRAAPRSDGNPGRVDRCVSVANMALRANRGPQKGGRRSRPESAEPRGPAGGRWSRPGRRRPTRASGKCVIKGWSRKEHKNTWRMHAAWTCPSRTVQPHAY